MLKRFETECNDSHTHCRIMRGDTDFIKASDLFLLDTLQGKFCMSVCYSVSYSIPYLESKLKQSPPVNFSHTASPTVSNVPHPCFPCPSVNWSPFPFNWSTNEQDHITDLSFPLWGRVMCRLDILIWNFCYNYQLC